MAQRRWAIAGAGSGTSDIDFWEMELFNMLRANRVTSAIDKQLRSNLSLCSLYWQFLHFIIEVNEPICNLRRGEQDECIQNPVTHPISY